MASSRGNAISAYSAPFAKGALIYGANVQSGVITSAHIANGTVVAGELGAGSVTSAKIGTGAVTSIKLGAASVISAKIGTGAVLAAALGAGAVTSAKLAVSAVVASKIRYSTVTGEVANSGVVYALAHGLGATPAFVLFEPRGTVGHLKGVATSAGLVGHATVSAHTSTNIYYAGSKNARFRAFCIV